ncbi:MAG: bifunctional alpha,alpha-trehalose-phosphate synthase (UDP-forming)/trehalose-phosphatase [Coriobacteriales bacterium]|nr:bifunctional alpha,alpha-trehalose-phosphate synthase (UDP-forming)/trehalose-phosphatase [Coriobacteriales bacterium]
MQRLISVSNRLPVQVEKRRGVLSFRTSAGGVATGLSSVLKSRESVWVGWSDTPSNLSDKELKTVENVLRTEHGCLPVTLSRREVSGFYQGFSNSVLWPLFHHMTVFAEFEPEFWNDYKSANQRFADVIIGEYKPGDIIWIHDYQLMLLPGLIREKIPDAQIGFFLHIPFPAFEMFRILPWRRELVDGLLGADLVAFHTEDYAHHFLESAKRLRGVDDRFGRLEVEGRAVMVRALPMGIDFKRYRDAADTPAARRERDGLLSASAGAKVILSVDRLDYTKGIPERLHAFDAFLERYPKWRGKVRLVALTVPSRTRVKRYLELKDEVDRLVGVVNGRWGTVDWTPVSYMYRSLPFERLVGLYSAAAVGLVTPLRDGMNLVAKEFVAANSGGTGVLVLSEMAGAAQELTDVVMVNPYDRNMVIEGIAEALEMPEHEQISRLDAMSAHLETHDVYRWAHEFIEALDAARCTQLALTEHPLNPEQRKRLLVDATAHGRRSVILDYDGTLVPFASRPEDAAPDGELLMLLDGLAVTKGTSVTILSGRDRDSLDRWFGKLPVAMVAEHGAWLKEPFDDWVAAAPLDETWKEDVRPILERATAHAPGSFIEEKEFSLVWHYRNADPDTAEERVRTASEALGPIAAGRKLALLEGAKVLEVKVDGVDKGRAAHLHMGHSEEEFVLIAGDDRTDESMFEVAPPWAWTVKVGSGRTRAKFSVDSWREVRALLGELLEVLG